MLSSVDPLCSIRHPSLLWAFFGPVSICCAAPSLFFLCPSACPLSALGTLLTVTTENLFAFLIYSEIYVFTMAIERRPRQKKWLQ